jgi:hypothetical protein
MFTVSESACGSPCLVWGKPWSQSLRVNHQWYQLLGRIQQWSTQCDVPIVFNRVNRTMTFENHSDLALFLLTWNKT